MTFESRMTDLAQAVAIDVKALLANQGNLATMTTTAKGSLAAAINELHAALATAGVGIDDAAGAGDTDSTWSANKIILALAALKSDLLNGVDPAWDTLQELAAGLSGQDSAINNLLTAVGNRVRFDAAQALTAPQQLQACQNLGIGDPDVDLVAIYAAAKA